MPPSATTPVFILYWNAKIQNAHCLILSVKQEFARGNCPPINRDVLCSPFFSTVFTTPYNCGPWQSKKDLWPPCFCITRGTDQNSLESGRQEYRNCMLKRVAGARENGASMPREATLVLFSFGFGIYFHTTLHRARKSGHIQPGHLTPFETLRARGAWCVK